MSSTAWQPIHYTLIPDTVFNWTNLLLKLNEFICLDDLKLFKEDKIFKSAFFCTAERGTESFIPNAQGDPSTSTSKENGGRDHSCVDNTKQ